ncbi:MAG: hypothetical protein KME38_30110 [Spirirestis rafaelensis WJT71-NPBG6]|nr:hypothetical protein [Spirirestis rafaelensis WJT71-NPBG6]
MNWLQINFSLLRGNFYEKFICSNHHTLKRFLMPIRCKANAPPNKSAPFFRVGAIALAHPTNEAMVLC